MARGFEALYYPYASVSDLATLKSALLYFDKVWVLTSHEASERASREFRELLEEGELIGRIDALGLIDGSRDLLRNAMQTDLEDSEFQLLTHRPTTSWRIFRDKGIDYVRDLVSPMEDENGLVKVPYHKGESFLLNLAILGLTTEVRQAIPLTDDEAHLTVLLHKLRRGARGQLEKLYGQTLERQILEQMVASIGRAALETVLPEPEQVEQIPLQDILKFRRDIGNQKALGQLRDAIFNALAEILEERPDTSPAYIRQRIQTSLHVQLRHLEQQASVVTRILDGFRAFVGVPKAVYQTFKAFSTGVPLPLAVAGEGAEVAEPVIAYVDKQRSLLRASDVAYLYRAKKAFASNG